MIAKNASESMMAVIAAMNRTRSTVGGDMRCASMDMLGVLSQLRVHRPVSRHDRAVPKGRNANSPSLATDVLVKALKILRHDLQRQALQPIRLSPGPQVLMRAMRTRRIGGLPTFCDRDRLRTLVDVGSRASKTLERRSRSISLHVRGLPRNYDLVPVLAIIASIAFPQSLLNW
jgi:hypothetical protein